MAYVAAAGYPVPLVYDVQGPDLVLERLDGETLLAAMLAGRTAVGAAADLLVGLHERLHALPARFSADPTDSILHLDLHPQNVMVTSRGPVVIDWRNAAEGPADLDVAMTALILAEVAVGPDYSSPILPGTALRPFSGAPSRPGPANCGVRWACAASTPRCRSSRSPPWAAPQHWSAPGWTDRAGAPGGPGRRGDRRRTSHRCGGDSSDQKVTLPEAGRGARPRLMNSLLPLTWSICQIGCVAPGRPGGVRSVAGRGAGWT